MDERIQKYEEKMKKTLESLEAEAGYHPRRTCQSPYS